MSVSLADGLKARIDAVVAIDPSANAIEFEGTWRTWAELDETSAAVARLIDRPGVEVGVILRNHPGSIGAVLGVLRAGGCVVTINPGRGVDRTREDIEQLAPSLVIGHPDDLDALIAEDSDATVVAVRDLGEPINVRRRAEASAGHTRPGIAVRMLTSGTTGPPKRIDLAYETFERVLIGAKHYESDRAPKPLELRRGVAIVNSPLAHVGGQFRVLQCVTDGRPFALLERFTVEGWLDAVRRHRPATASLVPTALRMVLEAAPDPVDLRSLRSVVSGTAPLDPDDADAFFERFGVPVLISYGATEFGGGVAGWNIADHREFWSSKRGSVGRAHGGCELRIVDADRGEPVEDGSAGLLEVRARQLMEQGWVRTTDLARIDDDGFLWILGRADQAIIRGGFKIIPDDLRVALERHPSVRGAAVFAEDDPRLGQVPIAAVELRSDAEPVTGEELITFLSERVARYEVPAAVHILEELPRTDSGKVDLRAVAAQAAMSPAEG